MQRIDDSRFECKECSVNTLYNHEYYMLKFELWQSLTTETTRGMLCIGCVETLLGRELTPDDFLDCPLNKGAYKRSTRLTNRLKGVT